MSKKKEIWLVVFDDGGDIHETICVCSTPEIAKRELQKDVDRKRDFRFEYGYDVKRFELIEE